MRLTLIKYRGETVATIREAELPGVGKKYEIVTENGEKITVVIHDDGVREIYHFNCDCDDDEPVSSVVLTDQESRQIGAIIQGSFYQPKALEQVELALKGMVIEWIKIPAGSPIVGNTIGKLEMRKRRGVIVIAVIEGAPEHDLKHDLRADSKINPGPNFEFRAGQTLVVAGRRSSVEALQTLIKEGRDTFASS
ncbi:MAG: cation:proton antiporter regulatory subunit [Bacillota bacterium]